LEPLLGVSSERGGVSAPEYVLELGEDVRHGHVLRVWVPVPVVLRPFLLVGEHLVRLGALLELLLRRLVVWVLVWVVQEGHPAVRRLDLLAGCLCVGYSEYLVVVLLSHCIPPLLFRPRI